MHEACKGALFTIVLCYIRSWKTRLESGCDGLVLSTYEARLAACTALAKCRAFVLSSEWGELALGRVSACTRFLCWQALLIRELCEHGTRVGVYTLKVCMHQV